MKRNCQTLLCLTKFIVFDSLYCQKTLPEGLDSQIFEVAPTHFLQGILGGIAGHVVMKLLLPAAPEK